MRNLEVTTTGARGPSIAHMRRPLDVSVGEGTSRPGTSGLADKGLGSHTAVPRPAGWVGPCTAQGQDRSAHFLQFPEIKVSRITKNIKKCSTVIHPLQVVQLPPPREEAPET